MADLQGTIVTWLGHATVHIATAKGTSILIDPFIEQNPKFPKNYKLPAKIDLILATHGHGDHIADLLEVAKKHDSTVVGMVELIGWAQSKGVKNAIGMNLGGSWKHDDVTVSMVEARHSSGISDGNQTVYGGEPIGFVVTIQNGPVLYHAGDTCAFLDMQLIRDLYHPQLAMLPIGDHYTMGPKGAVIAAKYLGVKSVLPIHYGTFPVLTGTPEELSQLLDGSGIEVKAISPGESLR
ncbi:metal-dependent hydrolase [Alloacidobacterium sp.]|uniref:metal-dependent hydrolase n=1 Tax=Alloacidobacterium sp. TaxID=2951999 RepID=UPI002D4FAB9E|nr:metal-dependent hydrolase [Alloacidobacterium sp.]HYK34522.1 metal-dependent hydrolase [Alloacidobacterium sp.]